MKEEKTPWIGKERGIMGCPIFSGKKEDYELWRVSAEDWVEVGKGKICFPALQIRMQLRDKAMEAVQNIDRERLKGDEGVSIIFKRNWMRFTVKMIWLIPMAR